MDYSKLDERIVRAIKTGATSFTALHVRLNELTGDDEAVPLRRLDGRLQALRRKGIIKYAGSGSKRSWILAEQPARKFA